MFNNLAKIMGDQLIKISDLHKKTGISRTTLTNIYYRRTSSVKVSTLIKICDALNVSLYELLDGSKKS